MMYFHYIGENKIIAIIYNFKTAVLIEVAFLFKQETLTI